MQRLSKLSPQRKRNCSITQHSVHFSLEDQQGAGSQKWGYGYFVSFLVWGSIFPHDCFFCVVCYSLSISGLQTYSQINSNSTVPHAEAQRWQGWHGLSLQSGRAGTRSQLPRLLAQGSFQGCFMEAGRLGGQAAQVQIPALSLTV